MNKQNDHLKAPGREATTDEQVALEGIPVYPASEDIYRQLKEEQDIDPENINTTKTNIITPDKNEFITVLK